MEDAHKLLKIPNSECPDIWIRLPRHKWPESCSSMEDPVVPLERNLHGHFLAGLLWERQFEKIQWKHGWEKVSKLGMSLCTSWKRIILVCVCGSHKIGWKETKSWSDVESTQQRSRFGRTNIFPWSCILGMHSTSMRSKQRCCWQLQNQVWIAEFPQVQLEKPTMRGKSEWLFMVLWHGWSCKEVCGTILWVGKQDDSTTLQSIYSMHWWLPLQRRRNKICWRNCHKYALKLFWNGLYLARIGRPDIQWSVNKLARSITKWTKACDKRLNRLISYVHHTCEYKQYCHVGNTAKQSRLGLFQNSDFAADHEDSKSISGGTLCAFSEVIDLFLSVGCVRNKLQFRTVQQNLISSLSDAGLRLDGLACSRSYGIWLFPF